MEPYNAYIYSTDLALFFRIQTFVNLFFNSVRFYFQYKKTNQFVTFE